MASLVLDHETQPAQEFDSLRADLIDSRSILAELEHVAESTDGGEGELRAAVARRLKRALTEGLAEAERLLLEDGNGCRCAQRICRLEDEIIRIIYEFARKHLYPEQNPTEAERMAVIATGGYGRGLQAPGSDIDLLFLLPYKQTAWGESVTEAILYCLWDTGLKVGHATRSIDECIRQAKADMTIRTAILEARFLFGDKKLFDELQVRFNEEVVRNTAAEFVAAKLSEREERHRRAGQSRYLVEPNVKDGKGGLRDLHTLFWIAKYVYRVYEPDELIARGVFDNQEYQLFRRCENFLWSVRCHMHFLMGRAEERLSFDIQREIAVRLGYTQHPGLQDVERFMKHYFLVAKDVGDLTAILCAELEYSHAKSVPVLSRLMARLRPVKARLKTGDFIVENNRLRLAHANAFKRDPINLIRIFHLAQKENLAFHPDVMREITRSLKLIAVGLRENAEANQLFLEILTSENDPETVLRRMNEARVLGHFVPAFGKIVAMMQFNMYHHYTVDEHLLRCIGVLTEIERGTSNDTSLANELIHKILPTHRSILYVALFLHDIAKGMPEDHSVAGARIARRFCPRFGFSAADTEMVAWLVENHLVMSSVAQSRDLSDRKTIENFAAVAQSVERLKLLTILTTADIKAVGPGVWNSWKAQLLRTLYYETEPVLTGGFSEVNRAQRVAIAQAEFRKVMQGWSTDELDHYVAKHYPAYWLKTDLPHKIEHARFVHATEQAGKTLATMTRLDAERGVMQLTLLAPDHPWLLSTLAGACAMAGANIVDAQIFTTTDGRALDTISLSREFERDDDEQRRVTRLADSVEKALCGQLRWPDLLGQRSIPRGPIKAFAIEPGVTINNQWSHRYTMVEITGLDRTGLLYEVTATLSKLNLNIASAHVATFGERVVDVFYVTDLLGAQINSPTRQAAIKRALVSLFTRPEDRAKKGH
jgi:[protein-PII] uridylyltransferase